MIAPDESDRRILKGEKTAMKKLMTLMLGLSFLATTVGVMFAQDQPKQETPKKKGKKGKKSEPKKDGSIY
jgi:hypothetical protein